MKVIEIEATNLCNADCLMCPRDQLTRSKGRMSWETFQSIADKALAFGQTWAFNFSGIGEPLLNRDLGRFVAYVSPHAETFMTTNGSLLNEAMIDALLEAGLHHLTFSFNGADAESYEHIMANLDFERTQGAVRRLAALADGSLHLQANVTVSKLTQDELPAIQQCLNEMGIEDIVYSLCHSRGGQFHDSVICDYLPPPPTTRCDLFADNTFVAWDGSVLACCQDLGGIAVLGDLMEMSMEELDSKRATILKEGVGFPMCPECDDIYRLYHDEPPPGHSLSEWIYRLYESKDGRVAALTEALRSAEGKLAEARSQLAVLDVENARLCQTIAGYESGRFIRFTHWLHTQRSRLRR